MSIKASAHAADLPALIERYFCEYLIKQRNASPETISSYRDTFRLFLRFSEQRFGRAPATLTLADFDAPQILAFSTHSRSKGIAPFEAGMLVGSARSFLQYAALQEPTALASISHSLAIPVKRLTAFPFLIPRKRRSAPFLMLRIAVPGAASRCRMFATMYNTGARVSEIIRLNVEDLQLGPTATVRIHGKGRKERVVPLWKDTRRQLADWLRQISTAGATLYFQAAEVSG